MDERSTLQFRSNMFPTSTKGQLVNDRKFLASISDPEALDILWRYNGSQGAYLNSLQQRQHDAAKHCSYAEEGDYPWGTPVGSNHVVCLCEKANCPRYSECMAPQPSRKDSKSLLAGTSTRPIKKLKPISQRQMAPSSRAARPNKRESSETSSIFGRSWSEDEKRKLREAYPTCSREALYRLFPNRSASDVDLQIDRMKLASLPRLRQTKTKQKAGKGAMVNQPDSSRKQLTQQPTKKKQAKTTKNPRPWTVSEDVVIRSNYPRFGSDMRRWKKQLYGRKKGDIEKRAKLLGLKHKQNH